MASPLLAANTGKVTGFAWAGNDLINGAPSGTSSIGWISFSSLNCDTNNNGQIDAGDTSPSGCPTTVGTPVGKYGVTITDDGNNSTATLSGYAWSDSLGWISFNQADLAGCPAGKNIAQIDITCPSNKCALSGCAKVISVNAGNNGGWDGWIKLNGVTYGVYVESTTGDFKEYATSSSDPATGTIGWIRFNGVKTDFQFIAVPLAKMACDASSCSGPKVVCDCDAAGNCGSATWRMYQPIGGCNFQLKNFSSGTVDQSIWTFDASHSYTFPGKVGTTVPNIGNGNYNVTLTVENSKGENTASRALQILPDAHAGFMCSFDKITWQPCSSLVDSAGANETMYFRDDQLTASGDNYSWPSGVVGAQTIVTRNWTLNGNSINPVNAGIIDTNAIETSLAISGDENIVMLEIIDNDGRRNSVSYAFNAANYPQWQEVSPIGPNGLLWKDMLAGIYGIFNGIPR